MTAFGWKASISCLILAAGSDASTGRIAGPRAVKRPRERLEQPGGVADAVQQHRVQEAAVGVVTSLERSHGR